MSYSWIDNLNARKVWLFDGGMGSLLQKQGLTPGGCPDEFNLSKPDIVRDIHASYVLAGSDIIQTNTFGANAIRLKMYDLADQVHEINARAVQIVREAVARNGKDIRVLGSIGPLGEILEPLGTIDRDGAKAAICEQALGLAEADGLNIETSASLDEVGLIIDAVRSVVDLPISVSMTFMSTPKGQFTMMGESPAECVGTLEGYDVSLIGANCGEGVEQVVEVISEMAKRASVPLLAKPNAGIPILELGEEKYPENADSFTLKMKQIIDAGATVIGGCCGTTPEHIKRLRGLADTINIV